MIIIKKQNEKKLDYFYFSMDLCARQIGLNTHESFPAFKTILSVN